jgi:hypothetical protein
MKPLNILMILSTCLALQGCIVAGAAVGATGAVVGTGVKVFGAVGRAAIPGESKKDREAREFKVWKKAQKAERS